MTADKLKRSLCAGAILFSLWLTGFAQSSDFEVVSSVPAETTISRAGTRDAARVWLEMFRTATISIDLAEFYLSGEKGEALEPLVAAVLDAGRRGVRVRILVEKAMAATYPETLARFRDRPGIAVRLFDWKALTGGVLHAKYFLIDGREAYVGSQNFDWRALTHIQETGLRIASAPFAAALTRIFDADWSYSGGDPGAYQKLALQPPLEFSGDARLVASPAAFNPPGVGEALEVLVAAIDGARSRISVQLLSYSLAAGGGKKFLRLDQALRRAAERRVSVRLLVADWNLRAAQIESLRGLSRVENIEVRFAVIPQARRGFIPYARVIHSKVMRVDDDVCWVGTSNWGHDYFFKSRNIEVLLRRSEIARVLDEIFLSLWNGPYVQRLDPDKEYAPPRID
ncbi:MAG TPA: phospholipase D-like domain-containing protein [Candidatus Binatia bacterium]|nr:phospholipase D-like domain-containing protein [Candidatus Binatia bacterium]